MTGGGPMGESITPREARLRTAAVAALTGLALVQLVGLPYSLVQGPQIAALSGVAIAAALRLTFALATAGADRGRAAWRGVAALGAVVTGGWLTTRAIAVPGVAEDAGHWSSLPGAACAALGAGLVGLGAIGGGLPPARRLARGLASAVAVCAALAPGAAALLIARAPAPGHHHGTAPTSAGVHALHGAAAVSAASQRSFRPGFGGHAGHYVYANATPPRLPAWALALALGAAGALVTLTAGSLRRRSAPAAPATAPAPRRARDEATAGSPGAAPAGSPAAAGGGAARRRRRRFLTLACLCAAAFAIPAASASAHATLLRSSPAALARLGAPPRTVTLTFSEAVQVVRGGDVALLDRRGRPVRGARARAVPGAPGQVAIALRDPLPPDSYTVRYRVLSADAHALAGALVFATGGAPLLPPAGSEASGPAETGPWAVDARFVEVVALGLLLALVAFRALVLGPALASARGVTEADRAAAAEAIGTRFWRAWWCVLALAGAAEALVVVVKAALVFGSGVWGSLTTPAAAERLVATSRFGDLVGWRGALLCGLAAVAFWAWQHERVEPRTAGGRPATMLAMAALSAGTLGLVSAQGHASQAPVPALSVAFDAIHLGAVAVWIGGLACLAVVLRAAPRALPGGAGAGIAAAALTRFSVVALAAFGAVCATGLLRAVGELADPAQLWATPYGRNLLLKTLLIAPVAVLAARNRSAVAALRAGGRPTAAALRVVWRDVRLELVLGLGIVLAAAVLVAQVPGRV